MLINTPLVKCSLIKKPSNARSLSEELPSAGGANRCIGFDWSVCGGSSQVGQSAPSSDQKRLRLQASTTASQPVRTTSSTNNHNHNYDHNPPTSSSTPSPGRLFAPRSFQSNSGARNGKSLAARTRVCIYFLFRVGFSYPSI